MWTVPVRPWVAERKHFGTENPSHAAALHTGTGLQWLLSDPAFHAKRWPDSGAWCAHIISRLDAFGSPPPCPSQPPPSQPPGARRSTVAHLLNPTPPLPPPTLNSLSILTMPPHHLALLRANNAPLMQTFTALLRDIHPPAPNVGTGYTAYQGLVEGLANTPLPLMS